MPIDVKELTICGVPAGSDTVEIGFTDASGAPVTLRMPFIHAQSLLMTLPRLLDRALRNSSGRPETRYVFPLGRWQVEAAADQNFVITTFATEDGFEVSFGVPPEACRGLAWALKEEGGTQSPTAGQDASEPARLN